MFNDIFGHSQFEWILLLISGTGTGVPNMSTSPSQSQSPPVDQKSVGTPALVCIGAELTPFFFFNPAL